MKTQIRVFANYIIAYVVILLVCTGTENLIASPLQSTQKDTLNYVQYKGSVLDSKTRKALVFASLALDGTNISTITNSEGEFSIKIPKTITSGQLTVTYLGYKNAFANLKDLKPEKNQILVEAFTITLSEIRIMNKEPEQLIREVMRKRADNYGGDENQMTAFYRETIRKRKTYVSLSESVVDIQKQPYSNDVEDKVELFNGRKNTDYTKLDTVTFKLQGGPYSTLYLDIMKYPENLFTADMIANYEFSLGINTKIGDKLVYVLSFRQRPQIYEPLYYGKLYIDMNSLAIISANFNLNISDRAAATRMFIKKKPTTAIVYPTLASYQINYREKDGKWVFGYSRGEVIFKVNWNRKFFNTFYESTIEMAVTDWEKKSEVVAKRNDKLKPSVIMMDKVSDFSDPEFWGEYNIIEPEKSIESAIKKIQRSLEK
jgi:hypothetical protein